jgi:ATP-dependent protease Clp ATPase subunit
VWCPFDTENSEFVLVLRENGYKVIHSHLWEGKDFLTYEPDEHYDCILSNPPFSIKLEVFKRLFELDGVRLEFEEAALDLIVDKAVEYKLGARGLRSICEAVMMDTMFEVPSDKERKEFVVTLDYAREKIERTAAQTALRQVG